MRHRDKRPYRAPARTVASQDAVYGLAQDIYIARKRSQVIATSTVYALLSAFLLFSHPTCISIILRQPGLASAYIHIVHTNYINNSNDIIPQYNYPTTSSSKHCHARTARIRHPHTPYSGILDNALCASDPLFLSCPVPSLPTASHRQNSLSRLLRLRTLITTAIFTITRSASRVYSSGSWPSSKMRPVGLGSTAALAGYFLVSTYDYYTLCPL